VVDAAANPQGMTGSGGTRPVRREPLYQE